MIFKWFSMSLSFYFYYNIQQLDSYPRDITNVERVKVKELRILNPIQCKNVYFFIFYC